MNWKSFIIISVFLFISNAYSSPSRDSVVVVDSTSKSTLYARSERWFINNFRDSKSVLEIRDSAKGEISGKGIKNITVQTKGRVGDLIYAFDRYITTEAKVLFSIQLLLKDNKYKFKFEMINYDMYHIGKCSPAKSETFEAINYNIESSFDSYLNEIVRSLTNFMKTPIAIENNDW